METPSYIKRYMPLWKGWELDKFLGRGSYGNVWQVVRETSKAESMAVVRKEKQGIDSIGIKEVAAIKEVIVPSSSAGTIEMACLQGLDFENAKQYFAAALKEAVAEAEMQRSLSDCHNIVRFRDYQIKTLDQKDEFGWVLYILMDKVKGFPEYLMDNGITLSKLVQLGIDLCHALERCQRAGIIHRDMKPENIFYCPQEDCFQLGDFGIARYLVRSTANKGRPGTLTHMSPEVYQGADFDYGDDLYALGMILYKLLNYNRIPLLPNYPQQYMPQDRENALIRRLKGESLPLPALTQLQPEQIFKVNQIRAGVRLEKKDLQVVQSLGNIVQKAISADKKQRYESAAEMRNMLKKISC